MLCGRRSRDLRGTRQQRIPTWVTPHPQWAILTHSYPAIFVRCSHSNLAWDSLAGLKSAFRNACKQTLHTGAGRPCIALGDRLAICTSFLPAMGRRDQHTCRVLTNTYTLLHGFYEVHSNGCFAWCKFAELSSMLVDLWVSHSSFELQSL